MLRGIDLSVAPHEVICLIGASGSGKSTLLRCVNLLERVNAGGHLADGQQITRPGIDANGVRRHIGIVFQAYNLFPHMTVLRNVTLAPVKALGVRPAQATEEARALLTGSVWTRRAEYPDRLSGGQQQRVAIVRALAMHPRLLLLDEVTSALDPELVAEVLDVIRELAGRRDDHADRHARDGLRQGHREPRLFPRRRPDRRALTARGAVYQPRDERTQRFLRRIIDAGRL